jgi:hypothetical protein
MPGINKTTYPADAASAAAGFAQNEADAPQTNSEPPLKCYVTASCLQNQAAVAVKGKARKCKKHKRHRAAEAGKRRHCKHKKRHQRR